MTHPWSVYFSEQGKFKSRVHVDENVKWVQRGGEPGPGFTLKKSTGAKRSNAPLVFGAEEGTRTPTPLRVHGPEPCASANSATSAR